MSNTTHRATYAVGILAVALVSWVGLAPAKSRPSDEDMERQCGARVKDLEAEVGILREMVRDLSERQSNTTAVLNRPTNAARIASAGNRHGKHSAPCDPPFSFDQSGIKFFHPECIDAPDPNSCSVPYVYTSSGIKTYKPNCLDSKPTEPVSCELPFMFDSRGIKYFRPECL